MSTLLLLGIFTGLDNFRVGIGLGSLHLSPRRRLLLALSFALFESAMPLVGLVIGRRLLEGLDPWTDRLGLSLLAGCGLLVLIPLHRGIDMTPKLSSSPLLFLLPPLLSLDNLLAGASLSNTGAPLAAVLLGVGVVSGGLSFLGMAVGCRLAIRPALVGLLLLAVASVGLW